MIDTKMEVSAVTVAEIYNGSNGIETTALYRRLSALGPIGEVAVNLFRACKSSERAKVYRGGWRGGKTYSLMAYDKKDWSLQQLCAILEAEAEALGIVYGWGPDLATPGYPWVLYVDLPTGQTSFHAASKRSGPDYGGVWDGERGASSARIIAWCEELLATRSASHGSVDAVAPGS